MFDKKDEKVHMPSTLWKLVADVKDYQSIDHYKVGPIDVSISNDGRYLINEPPMSPGAEDAFNRIYQHMAEHGDNPDYSNTTEEEIRKLFMESAQTLELVAQVSRHEEAMMYYLIRDTAGYKIIDVLMNDPNIEDITCENSNVPVGIIHRKYPDFFVMDTNIQFHSPESMATFTRALMQMVGKHGTALSPYVEGSTASRDRLSAFSEHVITPDGPSFTIRRFPHRPITMYDMVRDRIYPVEAAAYIWSILAGNGTGMVVGSTGSGKTTILNSLLALVNPRWKIILIEDTEEVRIPQKHGLRLKTRETTDAFDKANAIGIGNLLTYSLRQRPQFVVVGEVRLTDVEILFQVFETGHASLSTFHASSPTKALTRLEAKPIEIMASQKDDLWFILHVGRVLEDGIFKRKMLSLVETRLERDGTLHEIEIMRYNPTNKDWFGCDAERIVDKSERIRYAASLNGITDPIADMRKKVECIRSIEPPADTHQLVMDQIHASYKGD